MCWGCILFVLLSMALAQQMPFYDMYKVYRVVPETESQLKVLRQLMEQHSTENQVNIFPCDAIESKTGCTSDSAQ